MLWAMNRRMNAQLEAIRDELGVAAEAEADAPQVGDAAEPQAEAADPLKAVAARAATLRSALTEIEQAASSGNYAAVDNWARKGGQLEAMCRLVVKQLKKAEGVAT